jgi:hypothetical protein
MFGKKYFCSKQNCQNMSKNVFVKHALKPKLILSKQWQIKQSLKYLA